MSDDTERGRGILSPADRAYLRDPDSYSRQASYERESAIKERVAEGVRDLAFLFEHLPANIHAEVFGRSPGMGDEVVPDTFDDIDELSPRALAFVYSAARGPYAHPREDVLKEAIRLDEERQGSSYAVDVEVSIDRQPVSSLASEGAEKMDAGEHVSDAEVRAMLKEKIVDPEDVSAYLNGDSVDLPQWRRKE